MHSAACSVGASSANLSSSTPTSVQNTDGLKMVHNNEDAMNKIPLKSSTGMDDEEKNGGEFLHDTSAAEEARREQMRANILAWMKKLTIVLICFIGIALISYVVISLCFSEWPKSNHSKNTTPTAAAPTLAAAAIAAPPTPPTTTTTTTAPAATTTTTTDTINSSLLSDNEATPATAAISENLNTADENATGRNSSTSSSSGNVAGGEETADNKNSKTADSTTQATTAATTASTVNLVIKDAPITSEKFTSTLGVYEKAAVCSDKEVCSRIGSKILQDGGSAVDSAIAALLCNGLVTMQSMGIGGGMLMNIYQKDSKQAYSIDARERAPFGADASMFDSNVNASVIGGLSVAVPGELMGYHKAHEQYGKLPWKQLVEPSLQLCSDGFYISRHQHTSLKYKWKHLSKVESIIETFVNSSTGQLHAIGTKVKPPKALCGTYKLLAENGPMDFYNGTLAKLVAADLHDYGSLVTKDDLETYTVDKVNSISMQLGDDILFAVPPISSGSIVASIMSILEGYNMSKDDLKDTESEGLTLHRLAEALKYGFAKRWELGDQRFNDVRELVSKLTNPEFNIEIRQRINDSHTHDNVYAYGAQFTGVDDVGTSHLEVLAPNGDAVSVTSSINEYFGGNVIGARTGIIFNNAMSDFSIAGHSNPLFNLPPSPSNFIEQQKRPMSSMSPMILADQAGNVKLLIGSAGGSHIISAVAEVMMRVLWLQQNVKEAIDAPRIHHQLIPNVLKYEEGALSKDLIALLEAKGHKVEQMRGFGSVVCAIMRNSTGIYANADYRKHGGTAGY